MLGIVILNYKTFEETINCVCNINSLNTIEQFKIYIVDNCSPNESYEILSSKFKNCEQVKVIQSGKNGGFSYGNNIGFKAAIKDGCDKILCTNNDVEFEENSINIMCKDLDSLDDCSVVGPKVYNKDGSIQNNNRRILTVKRFLLRHKPFSLFDWFGIEKKYTYSDYKYDNSIYIEGMISGCCFMIKTDDLIKIDLLDENVFLYHEEQILGAKLRKCGLKVRLNPQSHIIHFGGKTTGRASAFLRYHSFYSALYYFKFYSDISRQSFNFVTFYVKTLFLFKSLVNKEYKQFYQLLRINIKKLKKCNSVTDWSNE